MNSKGFSLIETVLYLAIFGGVLAIILSFVVFSQSSQEQAAFVHRVEREGRDALVFIKQKIRDADVITSPIQGVTDTTLVLDTTDTFSVSSNRIYFGSTPLTSDTVSVSSFSVTHIDISAQISFTLSSLGGEYEKDFISSATLR